MATQVNIDALKREITEVQQKHPTLSPDNAFVFWFLRAYLGETEEELLRAIVGGANDKGVDAAYLDHKRKVAFLVQGKYRTTTASQGESHAAVTQFAGLAQVLRGEKTELENLLRKADAVVSDRLTEVHRCIHRKGYSLRLFFVSTGKISSGLEEEAQGYVSALSDSVEFHAFGRQRVLNLLRDYLDGAAPPVPFLDLAVETKEGARGGGMVRRYDPATGIESWVFSMSGSDVAGLFEQAGIRLFARNIRGFLGSTEINRSMRNTLRQQPENFWYFNNGITIVCDDAKRSETRGREILRVFGPQIINGQQTTRVLSEHRTKLAGVLVRVVAIQRAQHNTQQFEGLVSDIVAATNWQNAIKPSDLRANDSEQVRIDRELRRMNYQYIRKRQAKAEARRLFGTPGRFQIKKGDIARAVAAAELDPASVLLGTEKLFEEAHYSRIFDGRSCKDYLTLVWLDRAIKRVAKGRERRYARWLILNFAWRSLREALRREPARTNFIYVSERPSEWHRLRPLDASSDLLLRAALKFYRSKRGKGIEAVDLFTFFKRPHLDDEFGKFWRSKAARSMRVRAKRTLASFVREISSISS